MSSSKLDVGCGPTKPVGFVGIDCFPFEGVDIVFNIDSGEQWPFANNSFDYIRAIHVIEHLEHQLFFFEEIHRIARPDCVVHIETPHFSSCNSWGDPTHVRHYASFFMDSIIEGYLSQRMPLFEITIRAITFSGLLLSWPGWLIYTINRRLYEKYFSWTFPASSIIIEAKVLK